MSYRKHGKSWSIPEVLQLQREYELLKMDMVDIARKHERTLDAIQYKIESEGFVNNHNVSIKDKDVVNIKSLTHIIEHANVAQLEKLQSIICKRLNKLHNIK